MIIDIRNQIFALREAQAEILETVESQITAKAREIIEQCDLDTDEGREFFEITFRAHMVKEMSMLSTGYMTESIEGFFQPQIIRKLANAAQNPGSYALQARYAD